MVHVFSLTVVLRRWLAVGLLLLTGAYPVQAQPPASPAVPTPLPPIQVREKGLEETPLSRQTSAFATVIDTTDASATVDSVADILAESVGVQVRRFGGLGAFSTISIRGSTPSQVDVYLDDVLLNQANAGLVDLGNLPLDNIERIEIYRGFAPLNLGAGNIGGAVRLRTRQVAGSTTSVASASYGSFYTRKLTLYRSQRFDALGYLLFFNYSASDNDFRFLDNNGTRFNVNDDAVVARRNNDFRSLNGHAKGEASLDGWALTLSDDLFTKDQGVPGQSSIQSENSRLEVTRNVATLRAEKKGLPWSSTDLALQLAHTWQREHFTDPDGTIGVGVQDDVDTTHMLDANGLLTLYLEDWNQIVGVLLQGRYETFRSVNQLPEQRSQPADAGPLQQRTIFVVGLQDEILLFQERLSLRPLLRYQFVHSDFGADPRFGAAPLDSASQADEHLFSPSLGLKFRLWSFMDLKTNIGRFERVPTLFELFGDRGTTLGNPDLVSESSVNWDAGFAVSLGQHGFIDRASLEYAYFTQASDDLILFVQTSQITARAQNIGQADIGGHEVSWSVTALDHVRLFGNYTYQEARDTSDTFSHGNRLPGRPQHELYQALEVFAGFGKLLYEINYIADNFLDRANAFRVESRLLHNASLTVLPLGKRLKVTFEVKNITDNQIVDFRGFPLPGRSFFGTVEGRF